VRNEASANAVIIAVWVHINYILVFFIPTLATEASYLNNNEVKIPVGLCRRLLCFYIDR